MFNIFCKSLQIFLDKSSQSEIFEHPIIRPFNDLKRIIVPFGLILRIIKPGNFLEFNLAPSIFSASSLKFKDYTDLDPNKQVAITFVINGSAY